MYVLNLMPKLCKPKRTRKKVSMAGNLQNKTALCVPINDINDPKNIVSSQLYVNHNLNRDEFTHTSWLLLSIRRRGITPKRYIAHPIIGNIKILVLLINLKHLPRIRRV